jgi:GNAT superfamily N-acetyltransferase
MISYDIESFEDIYEEIKSMCFSHAEETEDYSDFMPLDPNFDLYFSMSEAGTLSFCTARDEKGKLVGYFSMIIDYHPHHKSILCCTNNLLYVSKEYRNSGVAKEMMLLCEEYLKEKKVQLFIFSAKSSNPLQSLAKDLGFDSCEVSYSKFIKGDI